MLGSELYLYNISEDNARFDTIMLNGGEFRYSGECNTATPYILVFPNAVEHVIFVAPGKNITYEASSNDLKNYVVKGTDENELMNEFRKKVSAEPKQTQQIALQYIKDNSESIVATYLFDRYFVQNKKINTSEISNILGILKKAQPENNYLLNIESKIKMLGKSTIGKVIPNFEIAGANKKKSKIWDKKNNSNTILLYWATWCNGCYDYLWKMRDIVRANPDSVSGRLVGISLDAEYYRFENDCRTDSAIGIEQYCDGLTFESPSVKEVGIPHLPYYIIVDSKHKVLTSGDDAEKMVKDIKKYIIGNKKK